MRTTLPTRARMRIPWSDRLLLKCWRRELRPSLDLTLFVLRLMASTEPARRRWQTNSCSQFLGADALSFVPPLMGFIILGQSDTNSDEVHLKDIFGIRSTTRH
jgi:hypothetical protein